MIFPPTFKTENHCELFVYIALSIKFISINKKKLAQLFNCSICSI